MHTSQPYWTVAPRRSTSHDYRKRAEVERERKQLVNEWKAQDPSTHARWLRTTRFISPQAAQRHLERMPKNLRPYYHVVEQADLFF